MDPASSLEARTAFSRTFGFLHFDGLFASEIANITAEFEAVWARLVGGHAGRPHDGERRSVSVPFIDQSERLSALSDDPRIYDLAAALVGEDFNYAWSHGNYFVGDTAWHSDVKSSGPYARVRFAFYLDPVTAGSGALRVIPGTHRLDDEFGRRVHDVIPDRVHNRSGARWGATSTDLPCVVLDSQPGDVLVFDQRIKHAAFGGGERRRMFSLDVQQRHREADLDLLRSDIAMLPTTGLSGRTARRCSSRPGLSGGAISSSGWRTTATCRRSSRLRAARCSSRLEAAASRIRRRRRPAPADERGLSPA